MTTLQIIVSALLSIAVLVGISMMSKVRTAVCGNLLSAAAVLCGVIATLWFNGVASAWTIYPSVIVGALIGSVMASRVQMIQMPQLVALFNGLGGGASALVGVLSAMKWGMSTEQMYETGSNGSLPFVLLTSMIAIAVGVITLTGSLIAAGKLHRVLPQKPVVWPFHSLCTLVFLVFTTLFIVAGTIRADNVLIPVLGCIFTSFLFGLFFSVRVGGADMPITISLLNALSGVAGSIAGMAISDVFLVAVGGIVGASGLLLTQIMCRAMNRSLMNILVGGKSKSTVIVETAAQDTASEEYSKQLEQRIMNLEEKIKQLEEVVKRLEERVQILDAAIDEQGKNHSAPAEEQPTAGTVLANAKDVIIVPGYGMALAQAQHQVKQLADALESRGARVRYAIHPVAGRMPGHMNVLLAEADVPYDQLYEMDAINDDFAKTDAVVVIGANDVMNPAARHAEGTPIYGMPVLNVDAAPQIIVCNYDLKPGYAGVENPIYTRSEGVFLELGDAKATLQKLLASLL